MVVGVVQPFTGDDAAANGFARALRDALVSDLGAIGVLDAAAATRLDALVAWRRGAAVEAQVTVTRAGHARLRKRYRAEPPTAAQPTAVEASGAVQSLLGELYDDPEFNLALKD